MDNTKKMPLRNWLPVVGLACSAFVFNTSEFVPIGLLSDIGADFGMSTASTGMLISVYAWVVMLLSLPLMILVSRMEMRRLMLMLVALFAMCQVMSYLSGSYAMLMASRIGVACAHSVFWSIVTPMAARMVPTRHRALALSIVATGSSIAMVFGMPVGRMIGLAVGWRMTFLSIGAVAAAIFVYLMLTLPKLPSRGKFSVRKLPMMLRSRALSGIYVLTIFFATAYYTTYSYIEPFLLRVTGMPDTLVTTTLMLFGGAGIMGSMAFSRYYNAHRYTFMTLCLTLLTLCLGSILPTAFSQEATIGVLLVLGMAATAFNIAMQSEIIAIAPAEGTSVAMSIFSGIFNFGIGTGAFIGGRVCSLSSVEWVGLAGAAIAIAALGYWLARLRHFFRAFYSARG